MSFPVKCLVDDSGFETLEHLHLYLRKLKIKQADYYEKYYKRADKFSGEVIKYKDYDQYFSTDFLNRNNIKKFIKTKPQEAKEWAISWLKKRKESKELVYAPTQVELRSLMCPTRHYYESVGGYDTICKELGYKIRFNESELKFQPLKDDTTIIIDSREQSPLKIKKYKTMVEKVDEGDYSLEKKYDRKIYIERKSLPDLVGSTGKDLGRFKREIQRAKDNGSYLVILVEASIGDTLVYNYLPQMRFTKMVPAHTFKNIRDLLHEFNNIQFLFVEGRKEAAEAVIKIFELGDSVKELELQYLYEAGQLKFNIE